MYDGRVKSDFSLFVGLVNSLRSFPNLPHLQNKISLLTLASLITIKRDLEHLRESSNKKTLYSTRSYVNWAFLV
jgi:hypothetical protein